MKKPRRRFTAVILSLCMAVTMPGTAAGGGTRIESAGLCEHHTRHTKGCGYAESQPCSHTRHITACYSDRLICGYRTDQEGIAEQTASGSDADTSHRHTQECYSLDCPHERGEHDETCGYMKGFPCSYVCESCSTQENPEKNTAETCICENLCLPDFINMDCPVCGRENADLSQCEGITDAPNLFTINDRFVENSISYKEIGSHQAQVIDGTNVSGEVVIPETVTDSKTGKSYRVVSIGSNAFYSNSKITKITFPDTITEIGDQAFYRCSNMAGALKLPRDLQSIGDAAFFNCTRLSGDLELPECVQSIGDSAFRQCSGFKGKLTLPESLQSIGPSAFDYCEGFTGDLILPSKLQTIENFTFRRCTNFTGNLILPDEIQRIGKQAFYQCSGFKGDLTFPDKIISIEEEAFNGCTGLNGKATLPDSLQSIGNSAFKSTVLTCYANSDKVASLAYDCGYRNIYLNDSLYQKDPPITFQSGNFNYEVINSDQPEVKEVKVVSSVSKNGALTIPETVKNNEITYTVTVIGNSAFNKDGYDFTGELKLPATLQSIEDFAFSSCRKFTGELKLPAGLQSIGDFAFKGCSGFTGELKLPANLQNIGNFAFSGCYGFTEKLTLPGNLQSIGDSAFSTCTGFTGELTLPDSLQSIGDSAFSTCFRFTGKLTLPANLQSIGNSAFRGCSGFDGELKLPENLQNIGDSAFSGCSRFTGELKLPENLQNIGDSAFSGCKNFSGNLILPDSIENIGIKAFENCEKISSVYVGSGVKTIGLDAFPKDIPLTASNARVQLLLVRYLDMGTPPSLSWNGTEDVPPDAIVTVDSDITISGQITVGANAEITISPGGGVTVTAGGSLVNSGTIINNGTMNNHGTITINSGGELKTADGIFNNFGTLDGDGTLPDENSYNHKKAAVNLEVSKENPAYGTDVTLTVVIAEEEPAKPDSLSRLSAKTPPKTVFVYCDDKEIGKKVIEDTGEKKATFPIAWENEIWTVGEHSLTAKYTGSNDQLLPSESAIVSLNVQKGERPRPEPPTVYEEPDETTVTLHNKIGQKYICTVTGDTPEITSGEWKKTEADTLTFSDLAPYTDYYFWTYIPGDAYYHDSAVSPALKITTKKNDEQKAVEEAKRVIEGGVYTLAQESAGDAETLKKALAGQINQLAGMDKTGITAEESNITIGRFDGAKAGDADDPDGRNGSFSFTVMLSKGNATGVTDSRNGTIAAAPFTGKTNAEAIAEATSVIEGGVYTLAQESAGDAETLKTALAGQINQLAGMDKTGITAEESNITIVRFDGAKAGDADDPDGRNGSFAFTVTLAKGNATGVTDSRNGTIAAAPFTGKTNAEAIAEAKSVVEGGRYTVSQADAGTEAALRRILAEKINGLTEVKNNGITITGADINLTISKAAVAGNAEDPDGTDGSFFFTVPLTKGAASDIAEIKDGRITAACYLSSDATLSNLTVTDVALMPAFDPLTNNYTASVGYGISNVIITAAAADKGATVQGDTGVQPLNVGSNFFSITVTAADGSVATYTITIMRARHSGGSGSSGNSGSYNKGTDSGTTVQTSVGPDVPTTGITQPLTPDNDGTVTVMDSSVSSAISAARQDARNKGNSQNGIAVSIPVTIINGQTSFRVVISAAVLDKLIEEQVTRFDIEAGGMVSYSFPLDALKELRILSEGGKIILMTEKQMVLTESALAAIGFRPAYRVSISYIKNEAEVPIPSLNGKIVTVKMSYIPLEEENPGALYATYVDDAGVAHPTIKSIYDAGQMAMIFDVQQFGIYGIGTNTVV